MITYLCLTIFRKLYPMLMLHYQMPLATLLVQVDWQSLCFYFTLDKSGCGISALIVANRSVPVNLVIPNGEKLAIMFDLFCSLLRQKHRHEGELF